MGKVEQERLYKHFVANSKNDKLTDIVKANALSYAKQILVSYPEFEVNDGKTSTKEEEKVEDKPKEETK